MLVLNQLLHKMMLDATTFIEPVAPPSSLDLKISPTIAANGINVIFNEEQGVQYRIAIYDLLGKCMLSKDFIHNKTRLDIGNYPLVPGLYVARVVSSKGLAATGKFIVGKP